MILNKIPNALTKLGLFFKTTLFSPATHLVSEFYTCFICPCFLKWKKGSIDGCSLIILGRIYSNDLRATFTLKALLVNSKFLTAWTTPTKGSVRQSTAIFSYISCLCLALKFNNAYLSFALSYLCFDSLFS